MSLRRMYDAAYPPPHPPAWEAVAGYLGGDTPHVWTRQEWTAQPARYRLGIWTRSNPAGYSGTTEGRTAAAAWRGLGAPAGTAIGLDFEQAIDGDYVRAFDAAVVAGGFRCVLYGAASYVLHNPKPSGGYWVAHWTGHPYLDTRSTITQYAGDAQLGADYDASLVSDTLTLWDTRPEETDMTITTADGHTFWQTPLAENVPAPAPVHMAQTYLVDIYQATRSTAAQIGALTATVSALAKTVGNAGGLTAEQITAAAQAGAQAALAELGDALTTPAA